jgi:thioredoxin 1
MMKQTSDANVIQVNDGDFDSEVLRSNVPVFVDFYADWCGPCKVIAPTIEALSKEYAGRVKFVKVNVDENQQVAMKCEIMGIPTAMLFQNGTPTDSVVGAFPAATYRQHIEHILSGEGATRANHD